MTLMNDTELALAKRLRTARLLADLEQSDIAERIGVARQTVSNWERGVAEPSATYFVRWAQETHQPLDWFAEGVARLKGFEPPTFCSVAQKVRGSSLPDLSNRVALVLLAVVREAVRS